MQKRILGISGSLRPNSSSHIVLQEAGRMLGPDVSFEMLGGIEHLPHFDGREEDAPEIVQQYRAKIKQADGVIICTPEYAFGIPGALKNALDWTVGTGEFVNKPVALITASSQGEKGHQALQWVLTAISANLIPEATLLISFVRAKVKDGEIRDLATKDAVSNVLIALLKEVSR
jgi:NAD(P)H-dependent FMN reductase